ncbi:MAG: META domain-containing protein [Gammaproteobacteria bacterium]|nr:META domain-containing protein [Gammaproteobacteria bacterium]
MSANRLCTSAALLLAAVFAPACPAVSLQGSEWRPLRVADEAVPPNTDAFIRFMSKGRLAGHSGCNRLLTEYQVIDDQIFLGPVAATRMMCESSAMAFEAAFAAALENARRFRRDGASLVLFDSAGQPILEMRQSDWD